ncbi:hypothetical protein ACQK5W_15960 [Pantoea sp. FN060301]|uniref:hypothetical protein n=1 Tax=Pantoea sp. FN060301 TaxID=3420380 RepID=UPI003D182D3A
MLRVKGQGEIVTADAPAAKPVEQGLKQRRFIQPQRRKCKIKMCEMRNLSGKFATFAAARKALSLKNAGNPLNE